MGDQNLKDVPDLKVASQDGGDGQHGGDYQGDGHDHGRELVMIKVDDKPVEIHRGRQPVSEIKRLGDVPVADELAEVIEGQPLKPLPDDGSVVIKGGEEFMSYPKDSGSSLDQTWE